METLAKSTRRVAEILDYVAQAPVVPTSRDIFEHLDLPRSSGYDLLTGLLQPRYLQRRTDGHWILGKGIYELALSRLGLGRLAEQIAPVLLALQEETQETAQLVVLHETQVLVTHTYYSPRSVLMNTEVGTVMPINWTAAGGLLIKCAEESSLRRILAVAARPSPTGRAVTDLDRLISNMTEAQRRGYAVESGEARLEAASIAAPVIDAQGHCVAAVSLALPIARMQNCQDTLVSTVRAAATKLSQRLAARK